MTRSDASWAGRTAAAREANRDKPVKSGGSTTVRAIRVPDEIWRAAQDVAIASGTNVSAMVVEFLDRAGHPSLPPVRKIDTDGRPLTKGGLRTRKKFTGTPLQPIVPVTPETCRHLVLKNTPLGIFCRECGTKVEAAE